MSNRSENENTKIAAPRHSRHSRHSICYTSDTVDDVTKAEKDSNACCYPESYWYKGIGLLFMCSIGFGSYFCYDNLGALEASRLEILSALYSK